MPTPVYGLRLPPQTIEAINQLSKIYGAPNGRAFAREILEVTTSGDVDRLKAFNARLIRGMGEQLTLKLNASFDGLTAATELAKIERKSTPQPKPARKRRKA